MLSKLLFSVFLFSTVYSASEADLDRKTKVQACLNILKAALHNDADYIKTLANKVDASNVYELESKALDMSIVNCYQTVTLIKSAELINKKYHNISPFTKENIKILELKNIEDSKFAKDLGRITNILKELDSEYSEYKKMFGDSAKTIEIEFQQREYEKVKQSKEAEDHGDYENGNTNLAFIKKMDKNHKLLFFAGFFGLFFFLCYLGLKKLMPEEQQKKSKKKKNKKE